MIQKQKETQEEWFGVVLRIPLKGEIIMEMSVIDSEGKYFSDDGKILRAYVDDRKTVGGIVDKIIDGLSNFGNGETEEFSISKEGVKWKRVKP